MSDVIELIIELLIMFTPKSLRGLLVLLLVAGLIILFIYILITQITGG